MKRIALLRNGPAEHLSVASALRRKSVQFCDVWNFSLVDIFRLTSQSELDTKLCGHSLEAFETVIFLSTPAPETSSLSYLDEIYVYEEQFAALHAAVHCRPNIKCTVGEIPILVPQFISLSNQLRTLRSLGWRTPSLETYFRFNENVEANNWEPEIEQHPSGAIVVSQRQFFINASHGGHIPDHILSLILNTQEYLAKKSIAWLTIDYRLVSGEFIAYSAMVRLPNWIRHDQVDLLSNDLIY